MLDTMTKPRVNEIDVQALEDTVAAVTADPAKGIVEFRVRSNWKGQTRSETVVEGYTLGGEFIPRQFKVVADEPEELLGTNTAPNPQELLMSAVNACMIVGYVANASVRGIKLDHVEIETHGELDLRGFLGISDDVPPGYRRIDYTVRIAGDATDEQLAEIHAAVLKTSPNFFNMAKPIAMNGKVERA